MKRTRAITPLRNQRPRILMVSQSDPTHNKPVVSIYPGKSPWFDWVLDHPGLPFIPQIWSRLILGPAKN